MTQEEINSTNWSQSVAGVCLKEGKVLLAPIFPIIIGNTMMTGN